MVQGIRNKREESTAGAPVKGGIRDPEFIVERLKDKDIAGFIERFFCARYEGLITPRTKEIIGFGSTREYVSALMGSLLNDPGETRALFFSGREKGEVHSTFRARNGSRKWLFEARAISPFLETLKPGSLIIDIGAGDNSFLLVLKGVLANNELRFLGLDRAKSDDQAAGGVEFRQQPADYDTGLGGREADAVILKAAAHHMEDMGKMMEELKRVMTPGALLILIEESSDHEPPVPEPRLAQMTDQDLNLAFYELPLKKRIEAMKFLDYYGVRVYRGWDDMPLPLNIHDINGWRDMFERRDLKFTSKVNMGFARPQYVSCLQRCNLVMVFSNQLQEPGIPLNSSEAGTVGGLSI
ncbi:methyltransferase domain-containing protein [Candidatus Micrarchaeota archaeon]|nr:methyltransferase domain-containing protein [Candidatus Micrarchaeota archaeon]